MKVFKLIVTGILCLWFAKTSVAGDGNAALYNTAAPKDAAYIRVFNYTPDTINVHPNTKSKAQQVAGYQMGDYLFLNPGEHTLNAGSLSETFHVTKKQTLTVVYNGSSLITLEDTYFDSAKKAQVTFYNLTPGILSLKTDNGAYAVFKDIQENQCASRKVNEINMAFAVYDKNTKVAEYEDFYLKKGRSYSYIVLGVEEQVGTLKTFVVPNEISSIE